MSFVLFKDKKKLVSLQVKKLNKNQIKITGCEINTSGFTIFADAQMQRKLGNYEDFTTLYQELEDESFILSNDGSVYPEMPENEKEPTLREMVKNVTEQNANVITELTNLQVALTEIYELLLPLLG